ncbi:MAG: hypothetical protein MSH49_09980 [[Eubacterium] saphenum]|nr:hypothetical protein [[Eubacterium] saphenum]
MKKTIKPIIALFVVLTLCLGLLAGCGGSGDVVGTWKVSGAEVNGQAVSLSSLDPSVANDSFTLNSDGTITAYGVTGGNWTLNGSSLTLKMNSMTLDCEFNGSNVIYKMGTSKLIYSRA